MDELIKQQLVRARKTLKTALEGLSAETAATIPEGFNNNIHWHVGHILATADFFFHFGNQKLPAHYNSELFGNGTAPANWGSDVPTLDTLLQQLDEQLTDIQALPREAFTRNLPKEILGNKTTGELAAMGAYHEAFHVGQIQTMKRLIEAAK